MHRGFLVARTLLFAAPLVFALATKPTSPGSREGSQTPAFLYWPSRCAPPALPKHADRIDTLVVEAMLKEHMPGVSVVVRDHGKILKVRSYGYADLETCAAATDSTLFGIGSVSKHFTAAAALVLVNMGVISLDDPIVKYLPEGTGVWDGILVRHLLSHTSGIPDYCGDDHKFPSMTLDRTSSPDTSALLKQISKAPLNFHPGTEWAYSNTGFLILSVLIERASGEPFPAFMHDHVFAPAGMTTTRYYSPIEVIPDRATPYWVGTTAPYVGLTAGEKSKSDGGNTQPVLRVTHGPFVSDQFSHWGDMGMLSTGGDLGRWFEILDSDRLLPANLRQKLWTATRLKDGSDVPYGFGLQLDQIDGRLEIDHSGSFRVGYTAMFYIVPDRQLGIALISNHYGNSPGVYGLGDKLIANADPAFATPGSWKESVDPDSALTAALLARIRGDETHDAVQATESFLRHGDLKSLRSFFSKPEAGLRFSHCTEVSGAPPGAFGSPVARQCAWLVTGVKSPQGSTAGLYAWFTTDRKLAGISLWY